MKSMKKTRNTPRRVIGLLALLAFTALCNAQELAAHWRFDEQGGEFPNLSGGGFPAKVQPVEKMDSVVPVPDEVGEIKKVVGFDGSGDYWISAPAQLSGNDFTVELWIKVEANNEPSLLLGNRSGVMVQAKPGGTLLFFLAPEGAGGPQWHWSVVNVPNAFSLGEWIHVMARFSENAQQLSVDNGGDVLRSEVKQIENPAQYQWPQTVLGINTSEHTQAFSGRIAAMKLYEGALSEEDFKKSMP